MNKFLCTIVLSCLLSAQFALAQSVLSPIWDNSVVNSIHITIPPDSLQWLYDNVDSSRDIAATFVYEYGTSKDTVPNIGFRLRGNTSRYAAKKSFKVDFNHFVSGRTYYGEEALNLNGSHNDPTMVREKTFFDIWERMGMPERLTAFVNLYINGGYYGLYTDLEEYDEVFLQARFGNSTGNLYKCTYPADLAYHGTNQDSYKSIISSTADADRAYELETNTSGDNYSDLVNFITVLNETPIDDLPCELEKVFDVDSYLRDYAEDVSTGNWDDYPFNQNNYYVYDNPATGKFFFLAYDCDNTIGVDFEGVDWGTRNMYSWYNTSYPLIDRIMQVQEYKDRYSYYINQLVNGAMLPAPIDAHIDSMKTQITPFAKIDSFRTLDYGYTFNDFLNAFTTNNIDGHTPYGVENFVTTRRTNTESQLMLNNISPVIRNPEINPQYPVIGQPVNVTVFAFDDGSVQSLNISYSYDSINWTTEPMYDDGLHNDGAAGDSTYGAAIAVNNTGTIWYYFTGTDNTAKTSRYPVCDEFTIRIGGTTSTGVVINEFMAKNNSTIADNYGKYSDWIELYNPTAAAINLGDKFLTDNLTEPNKWQMPDTTLAPNSYILIWADDLESEGVTHANFKLSSDGEQVGLFGSNNGSYIAIDTFTFGAQQADISMGRWPNGSGPFVFMNHPTPDSVNVLTLLTGIKGVPLTGITVRLVNNPVSDGMANISVKLPASSLLSIQLYNIEGKTVLVTESKTYEKGEYILPISCSGLAAGNYIMNVTVNGNPIALKMTLQ